MKILKNAGKFEVLCRMDEVENIVKRIANAARTCYQSFDKGSDENDFKLVKGLLRRGHHAMLEFVDLSVRFSNVSRGFTHEMVRHRLCSFAQESTRYVDESDFKCVVPPHKDEDIERFDLLLPLSCGTSKISLKDWFELNEAMYRALRNGGWRPEDARQVLPIGIKSQIAVKANLREWRHIFTMRCSKAAHWEIRRVMLDLLTYCKNHIPLIFDDFVFSYDGSGNRTSAEIYEFYEWNK